MNKRIKNKKLVEKYRKETVDFFKKVEKHIELGRELQSLGGMVVKKSFLMSKDAFFKFAKHNNLELIVNTNWSSRYTDNEYHFIKNGIKYFTLADAKDYLEYYPEKKVVKEDVIVVDGVEYVKKTSEVG